MLYNQIQGLQNNSKITIHSNLCDLLKAEGIKNCFNLKHQNKLLTTTLKEATNQLFDNLDITIRTGDKSNIYIISNKTDYNKKIENILNDKTKFKKLTKNPTDQLKKHINKIVTVNNTEIGITGEYKPGYIYDKIKTHKQINPIRPDILQIPTPLSQKSSTI